jgi:hypothetical protein
VIVLNWPNLFEMTVTANDKQAAQQLTSEMWACASNKRPWYGFVIVHGSVKSHGDTEVKALTRNQNGDIQLAIEAGPCTGMSLVQRKVLLQEAS